MKTNPARWLAAGLLSAALATSVGCGGGSEEESAPPEEAAVEMEPAPEAEAPAEESTTDVVVIEADQSVAATPQEYDQAMQQQNYVQAADLILRMNAQGVQGANTIDRMRALQDEVARAAYSGDPKAQQAAEMLRRIGRLPPPPGGQ